MKVFFIRPEYLSMFGKDFILHNTGIMKFILPLLGSLVICYSCSIYTQTALLDERDGQEYPVVQIGDQYWMAANLAYLPEVCPSKSECGFYVYGYEGSDVAEAKKTMEYETYGVLYNWYAAMDIDTASQSKGRKTVDKPSKGICPDGWHLPSDDEVSLMEKILETNPGFDKNENRRKTGDVGKKIKSGSGWSQNGNGTNESGLGILPSGIRYQDGYFTKQLEYGYFWTSTEEYETSARYRFLVFNSDGTYTGYPDKRIGMPVRCIRD